MVGIVVMVVDSVAPAVEMELRSTEVEVKAVINGGETEEREMAIIGSVFAKLDEVGEFDVTISIG